MPAIYATINQLFMKIVLLGYMGSGKSTLARLLAENLEYDMIDLDDYIVEREGMSIPDLFENKGEIYFRLQESKYLKEILGLKDNLILSLGGGTPCYANNMHVIKNMAHSFYLKASIDTLCTRLRREKAQRPLIASLEDDQLKEFVAKHLFERRNFYEKADATITIDQKSVEELLREVLQRLKD